MLRQTLLLLLLVPALFSCKGDDEEAASRSVIDGVWESACVPNADESSQQIRYTFFVNNAAVRQVDYYADAACTVARGKLVHEGTYALAVREELNVYDIDFFFDKATAIPATAEGAAAWNTQHFCALTRWLPLVDEEVISQSDPACGVFGVSRIEYRDLIRVDEEKTLIFGTQLNHLIPRPTSVDASNPLNAFTWVPG